MIKKLTSTQTYPLRSKVLRPGLDISSCMFSEDNDPETVHFGSIVDEQIVSIVSLMPLGNDQFSGKQFQLRGMATEPSLRGQGHATNLLKHIEDWAKEHKIQFVWCNARESAISFYVKHAYQQYGELFEIEGVGSHAVCATKINPI